MKPQTHMTQHVWWLSPYGDIPCASIAQQHGRRGQGCTQNSSGWALMFWGLQQNKGEQRPLTALLSHLPSQRCCLGTASAGQGLSRATGEQGHRRVEPPRHLGCVCGADLVGSRAVCFRLLHAWPQANGDSIRFRGW